MAHDNRVKERKTKYLGQRVTPSRHDKVVEFVEKRDWDMSKFLQRAIDESMAKVIDEEKGSYKCVECDATILEGVYCDECSEG